MKQKGSEGGGVFQAGEVRDSAVFRAQTSKTAA